MYLEISGGENARAGLDYTRHYRCPRMLGMDRDYSVMHAYDARGWPRFVVIDREGIVRFHGFPQDQELRGLRACLNRLVSNADTPPRDAVVTKDGACYLPAAVKARSAIRDRSPRLALDANGRPHVVYWSNRDGVNAVYLCSLDDTGEPVDEAITPTDNLGRPDCYAPDCTFDPSGNLWIVWCGAHGKQYDVFVQRRDPEGQATTTRLTQSDDDAMRPRIAAGSDGRVTVTYYKWHTMRGTSRDRDIFARTYVPATRTWLDECTVSPWEPEVEDHTDPDVALNGDGNAWVAWSYDYHPSLFAEPFDTDQPSVFAARLDPGGEVSSPILVGTLGVASHTIDLFPSLAIDGAGTLWCAWDAFGFTGTGGRSIRLVRLNPGTERFANPTTLNDQGLVCSTPALSPGNDGVLLATWSEFRDNFWRARAVVLRDGARIAQTTVAAAPSDVLFPQIRQGRDGRVWLTYERCDETGSQVILTELTKELTLSTRGTAAAPYSEG